MCEKFTADKMVLDGKYKELKNNTKDVESTLKKQISEIQKEKAVSDEKSIHLENKIREIEEKRLTEMTLLQVELNKNKDTLEALKKKTSDEIYQLK
jgi:hypothetical protein